MDNYTGKRLDGRYEIQEVIGVGGMAVVYKAYDNIDDRVVAIKILKDEFLASEEFRRRFKNESKAIAVLSHPNIVKVYDVSYGDRLQYIVMEYVEGITLKEYIEQQGKINWREAIHFMMQILRALQHAHDKGIVHRDVKPQNIMLLQNGNIKVADFGIARFSRSDTRTMTDSAIGSVHYISPEQARGDITDDKADIYSVGVVLYEMLTGQLPFQSNNTVSVAIMQLQSDPVTPRSINPNIPAGLEQITMHAMQKNTKDRYQSAAEMLLDLEEVKRNPNIKFDYSFFVDNTPTRFVSRTMEPVKPAPVYAGDAVDSGRMDEELEEDAIKSKTVPILVGIAGSLVVLVLGILAFIYFFGGEKPDKVEIPNFVGKIYETIVNDEAYQDFEFVVTEITSSTAQEGAIARQDPPRGTMVNKSGNNKIRIQLDVNKGKPPTTGGLIEVPDVYLQNIITAKKELDKYFLVRLVPEMTTQWEENTVIRTSPERNKMAEFGSTLQVFYATQEGMIEMPDLVNWELTSAKSSLTYAKLVLGEVTYEKSHKRPNTVIGQSIEKNIKVAPGTKIDLTVSNGEPPESTASFSVRIPNKNNAEGTLKIYVDGNPYGSHKTVLLDGKEDYPIEVVGSGSNQKITVIVDSDEIFSCKADFTKDPAVLSDQKYGSSTTTTNNPARAPIPNVKGRTYEDAIQLLKEKGFENINRRNTTVTDENQVGIVLTQNPESSILPYSTSTVITLEIGVTAAPTSGG